nr:unnamed protein product [Spirometra erinaceieuropaei]
MQQHRQNDHSVRLQFGVDVESVLISNCFADSGNPAGHFIAHFGVAREGAAQTEVVAGGGGGGEAHAPLYVPSRGGVERSSLTEVAEKRDWKGILL